MKTVPFSPGSPPAAAPAPAIFVFRFCIFVTKKSKRLKSTSVLRNPVLYTD